MPDLKKHTHADTLRRKNNHINQGEPTKNIYM